MYCFVEGNKSYQYTWILIPSKSFLYKNIQLRIRTIKAYFIYTRPVVRIGDPVTCYCLSTYYIYCPPCCLYRQQNFRKTSKLSYYFYMVKIMYVIITLNIHLSFSSNLTYPASWYIFFSKRHIGSHHKEGFKSMYIFFRSQQYIFHCCTNFPFQ